jgi:hypothetical protein
MLLECVRRLTLNVPVRVREHLQSQFGTIEFELHDGAGSIVFSANRRPRTQVNREQVEEPPRADPDDGSMSCLDMRAL